MNIVRAKLVAYKEELGGYMTYVFRNAETGEPIMCTKFTNWNTAPVQVWSTGYLAYKSILPGVDKWYDPATDSFMRYRFEGYQFINFVPELVATDEILMV